MALKKGKFEKMVRGHQGESFEKETVNEIRINELERLKQLVFVNSLNHIEDGVLRDKCSDISTHYRMFKNDETHYTAPELSDDEKRALKNCIGECVQKECTIVIREKNCIPTDLLKMIESKSHMAILLKDKLNVLLSLLNEYHDNKSYINNSLSKLLDSSRVNISEACHLSTGVEIVKVNAHMLQSDMIHKFSCSEKLYKSLEMYYSAKEKEYAVNLKKMEDLQELQNKYKQVDGENYRELVKKFIQIQKMIKTKKELFNSLNS